jgi:integrase
MSEWRQNTQMYKGGKLRLFQRADSMSGYWQAQISLGQNKYVTRTMKTGDLNEAMVMAYKWFDEIEFKQKYDIPVSEKTFVQVANQFIADYQSLVDSGIKKQSRLDLMRMKVQAVLPRYFDKKKPQDITAQTLTDYVKWRNDPKNITPGSRVKTIAQATIDGELSIILSVLTFAKDKGYIREVPKMKFRLKSEQRDAFTDNEVQRIDELLANAINKCTTRHRDNKVRARILFNLLIRTGMRPGEVKAMKLSDIDVTTEAIQIYVSSETKTGRRTIACEKDLNPFVEQLLELHKGDPKETKPYSSRAWYDKFTEMLVDAGLDSTEVGNRTAYSCRHTYITNRIRNGTDIYVLAKNTGTSVTMIERFYGHMGSVQMVDELTKVKETKVSKKHQAATTARTFVSDLVRATNSKVADVDVEDPNAKRFLETVFSSLPEKAKTPQTKSRIKPKG